MRRNEELIKIMKEPKDNYIYLYFNELFILNSPILFETNCLYIYKVLNIKNKNIVKYKSNDLEEYKNLYDYFEIVLIRKDIEINMKFIYYYLNFHNDYMKINYYKGNIFKYLLSRKLREMMIVIPPLEKQNRIVKELDYIKEDLNKRLKNEIENNNKFAMALIEATI